MIKKIFFAEILLSAFFFILAGVPASVSADNSSILLKKPVGSEYFNLTISDPNGIQEFSLSPVGRYNYGGGLSGCPRSFNSTNVSFLDPSDFTPAMPAYVIDCQNHTTRLEIATPKNGVARSVIIVPEEEKKPAPAPAAPSGGGGSASEEAAKTEKKSGPLSTADIKYPVPELGDCKSEAECRTYCDNSQHGKECFVFAKKYNLITAQQLADEEKKFFDVTKGPGGCDSGPSCEKYCNTLDHVDECIAFAEKSGYYSGDKLTEAKKFQELAKNGTQFPGGCRDRNACELYCNDPQHMEECLSFAEKSGVIPKEEIDQARKILPLMKSGQSPGGCTSKEQCEKYCSLDGHSDECIAFGEKAGLISSEDAAMIKKTGGKGPGGCHSKQQCDSYCENNSDECFKWAQDNGLISDADLQKMKKGMSQFKEQLDKIPPEVVQCLKDVAGEKNFQKLVDGQPVFDRSLEGKMKTCFSQVTSQLGQQLNSMPPEAVQCIKDTIGEDGFKKLQSGELDQGNVDFSSLEVCFQKLQQSFGGGKGWPGGCKSIDECTSYCQEKSHEDECQKFVPPGESGEKHGGPGSQQQGGSGGRGGGSNYSGPGGCKSQEECTSYCQEKEHQDECQKFVPPGGGGNQGSGGMPMPNPSPTSNPTPMPPQFSGPGGCKSQEECAAYCQTHYNTDPACGDTGSGGSQMPMPPPSPQQAQSCAPVPSGLVTWINGESMSGAVGGASSVPGKIGNAYKFNGTGAYINLGNPANLNFGTGPFSLEAWFNWDGTGNYSALNIIRKSNYGPDPGSGYWVRIGRDSKTIEFSVGATIKSEGQTLISAPITPNAWHYVVATRDTNDNVKLYIDGESRGSVIRQVSKAQSTSPSSFAIGGWDDQHSEFFPGLIDEVSVYNRALDSSEIQTIYAAGSAGKCTR